MTESQKNMRRATETPSSSSAGVIILQWLTYAFWGWTLLSLVWLIFIVVANTITDQDTTSMVPYAIAATLVLLPLSVVCDVFYGRREPAKKTGAAMVVMVIHAVIFALFGIGLLISGVLVLVQMTIGSSDSTEVQTTWVVTAFTSAIIYAFTFVRTLNPNKKLRMEYVYPVFMAIVVGVFIVLGFVGPVAQAGSTRDDRDVATSISGVSRSVDRYVTDNNKLPDSLQDVSLSAKQQSLVDRGLVTYKKEDSVLVKPDYEVSPSRSTRTEYRYQLCTTYKKADNNSSYDGYDYEDNEYVNSPSTYGHPAGDVCYKLKVDVYNRS